MILEFAFLIAKYIQISLIFDKSKSDEPLIVIFKSDETLIDIYVRIG